MKVPYLIFENQTKALEALETINNSINDNWSTPVERLDGKYCFPKPDDSHMVSINYLTIEEYTHFWFITEEDFLRTLNYGL